MIHENFLNRTLGYGRWLKARLFCENGSRMVTCTYIHPQLGKILHISHLEDRGAF